jgi:hypothetical protein
VDLLIRSGNAVLTLDERKMIMRYQSERSLAGERPGTEGVERSIDLIAHSVLL